MRNRIPPDRNMKQNIYNMREDSYKSGLDSMLPLFLMTGYIVHNENKLVDRHMHSVYSIHKKEPPPPINDPSPSHFLKGPAQTSGLALFIINRAFP